MRALAEAAYIHATQPRRLRCARRAIAIGGAVLGGTGKTPLAIAVARHLAPRVRVAIVGHAHRAKPERARVVQPNDSLDVVGDEALLAARHAIVVVAPSRQAALDLACEIADVVILDGVLQLEPRAALSVLTVPDSGAPSWLERRADLSEHVRTTLDVAGLRGLRVGLATCLARPERVVRALADRGVEIAVHRAFRDHGPAGPLRGKVDVWVATEKCALHLSQPGAWSGSDKTIHVLRQEVALSAALRACLDRLAPPPYSEILRT